MSKELSLTAIITGAGGGLGREYALLLTQRGYRLAVTDIDAAGLEETCQLVRAESGEVRSYSLDVTDAGQWQTLQTNLRQDWPQLNLLVNSAGISHSGAFATMDLAHWRQILSVNLEGTMLGCRTMAAWLAEATPGGHIINTASFAAMAQGPYMSAYNVSKAAVVALSESLYTELSPQVGVTVVCPWFFRSGLLQKGRVDADWLQRVADHLVEISPITATDVALDAIRAMEKKKLYALVTARGRRFWWLKRIAPQLFLGLVRKQFARMRTKLEVHN